jgi:RNA polymerase sigma factor (sigma-70 family)
MRCMMTTSMTMAAEMPDAELVEQSLDGNRDAFGRIVSRYQSLICSLAYSATGSLGQSEDLAQETFITAWKHLRHLRERNKLRAWLCGIARNRINNSLRREGRQPLREAEPLEAIHESPATEPLPLDQTITNEEAAILWRSLERVPEIYREPLILFYREHQSIESVADALDLTEDAVKQRLSRGRKLLQDQVLAFVEGALQRTAPGKAFTVGVLMALPAFTLSAKAATVGATAVKGTATAKAAGFTGILSSVLGVFLVVFGNYVGYRMSIDAAHSDKEREYIRSFYRRLVACIVGFGVGFALVMLLAVRFIETNHLLVTALVISSVAAYLIAIAVLTIWSSKRRRELHAEYSPEEMAVISSGKPAYEYLSQIHFLGMPLVHIRIGGGIAMQRKVVKAWIAVGDCAIGGLFAFGGMAIAPFSMGGLAVGILPFGGCAVGVAAIGGFALGGWAWGGLALGWQAFGGCALALNAAVGGAAIARGFAEGGFAQAAQANNELADHFVRSQPFFRWSQTLSNYAIWINLVWVLPMIFWWRIIVKNRRTGEPDRAGV